MISIKYINESGNACEACFEDDGKFEWYAGTYPKIKTYMKQALYFQDKFKQKLSTCKQIEIKFVNDWEVNYGNY